MKTFLLIFLCLVSTARAELLDQHVGLSLSSGNPYIIVIHNHTALDASLQLNGTRYYNIKAGETRECLVPSGFTAIVQVGAAAWYAHEYLGDHCDGSKPYVRHVWLAFGSGPSYEMYRGPGVNIPNPYTEFARGVGVGLVIAIAVAIFRYTKRAFAVSTA
jgi:hypothetical protein